MSKYNLDFKLKVIQARKEKSLGFRALADRFNVNHSQVRHWVKRYERYGIDGLKPSQSKRHYSPEFKLNLIQKMMANDWSMKQTALHFNISSPSLITQWLKQYNQPNHNGLLPKPKGRPRMNKPLHKLDKILQKPLSELTQDELIERLKYMEAENAYLKKLEALEKERAEQK